jgi:hypothetical protein
MRSIGLPTSYGYVEETPDLEIIVEIQYQDCEPKPEETFSEHYIF